MQFLLTGKYERLPALRRIEKRLKQRLNWIDGFYNVSYHIIARYFHSSQL